MKGPPSRPTNPRIQLKMTDLDVMEKVARIVGKGNTRRVDSPSAYKKPHWKLSYQWEVSRITAYSLMGELYPYMGERRKEQIKKAMACYDPSKSKAPILTKEEINKIIYLRDEKKLTYSKIAKILSRNRKTIESAYYRAKKKPNKTPLNL